MALPNTDIDKLGSFFRYAHKNINDVFDDLIENQLDYYVKKTSVTGSMNVTDPGYYVADAASIHILNQAIDETVISLRENITLLKNLIETTCLSMNGHPYGSNPLPYGTDLNNYFYIHQAIVPYDNVGNLTNCPTTMGFKFCVLNMGTPVQNVEEVLSKCSQVVIEMSKEAFIYIRSYSGLQWSEWIRFKNDANMIVSTEDPGSGHPGDIYFKI